MYRFVKKMCMVLLVNALIMGISMTVCARDNTIESGIYVGELELSGLTINEAQQKVASFITSLKEVPITLTTGENLSVTVNAGELGLKWDSKNVLDEAVRLGKQGNVVQRFKALQNLKKSPAKYPLQFSFDEAALDLILEEQASGYDRPAINASLKRENGEFQITPGQTGYILDRSASKEKILSYLGNEWNYTEASIDLVTKEDEPEGNTENLSMVKDVLGTYTTNYKTSGSARCKNVANGCSHLNGITLYPGEQVSVLGHITPFTQENGYELAGSYLNGQVVETFGGGICQVSTTLYNAVLRSELQVDERNNHSMIISYVKPSEDAAIAESSGKDFKFTNNTDYPIYIEGVTPGDKTITFTIYGVETRPASHSVEYQSEILETNVPETESIIQSAQFPIGYVNVQSVHVGYKARLWKITKENGEEVSREQVNSSSYKAVPRTATVGTATNYPDLYNQLQAAIATGSIDYVKQVAAALGAQNAAADAQLQALMAGQTEAPSGANDGVGR